MNGMKPVCAILFAFGVVTGCGSEVTIGGGGSGGSTTSTASKMTTTSGKMAGDCSHANPYIWGSECELSNEGTICSWEYGDTGFSGSGLIQCTSGEWVDLECPYIQTDFTCPEQGEAIDVCPSEWTGFACPWQVADAGFTCYGNATCTAGKWVSNGATYVPVGEGGAGGNGAGGFGGSGGFGSTGSVGGGF